jgi:hypothetical protein
MSSRNDRFLFTRANPDDAQEILEILEENAFPGGVSLLYTRRPDPYLSYLSEGDETILVVCRDLEKGKIAGLGVCSIRELYVDGQPTKVGYLEGLRVRAKYRTQIKRIPEGYNYIFEQGRNRGVKYYLTTILEENLVAQKFLEARRSYMPDYVFLLKYSVLTYRGQRKAKLPKGYLFRPAIESDFPSLVKLLNDYGCKNQFHPVVTEDLFRGKYPDLTIDNFYVLLSDDEVVACGAIWNQRSFKQYIVKSYSGIFKLLSFGSRLFPFIALPPLGGTVALNMLAFCGVKDADGGYFEVFLKKILAGVPRHEYISIGFANNNPLLETARGIKHILYKSRIYLVDPDKTGVSELGDAPMHIECSTL